jgi:PAS domain S-box-containing protein
MNFAIMPFLRNFLESGVAYTNSKLEKRNIIMTNYLSAVLAFLPLGLIFGRLILGTFNLEIILWLFFGVLLFCVPIFLNRFGFTLVSRFLLCWGPPTFVFITSVFSLQSGPQLYTISDYIGLRFFLLAFSYYPFLVFNLKDVRYLLSGLLVPFLSILMFDYILNFFNAGYSGEVIRTFPYEFNTIRAMVSFVIIGSGCFFLKRAVESSEDENSRLLFELARKNKFIQQQAKSEVHQLNSQLKANLQQLSEREFILNQSQRIAKLGSWEYHIENDFLFWSDEMYDIFGLDKSFNIKTGNLNEALGKEGGERFTHAILELLRVGEPFDIIIRTKTPIGYVKWFRVYAFPIVEGKNATGVTGICHDITFFKEAEEKLRSSEVKFSTVFENFPDFIMVVRETDLFVMDVNQRITHVLGFRKDEVIGQSARVMDLFLSEEERQAYIQSYMLDGYTEYDGIWKRKDGRLIDVKITGIRINIEGEYYRMSVVQDVTDKKQSEKEKEYARYLLNERIKELTTLYRVSQILRTEKKPFHEVMHEIVSTLPMGWQYSDIAVARIHIEGEEYATPNFHEAKQRQRAEFNIHTGSTGFVEVAYTAVMPQEVEGPFLREERDLINMIANKLREYIERRHERELLAKAQANLNSTINNTEVLIWSVDRQFRLIMFNIPFFEYVKKYYGFEIEIGKRIMSDDLEVQRWWDHHYLKSLSGEIVSAEETRFGMDIKFSLSPIIEDMMITGVSVFADNVTERKTKDRQLAEANIKIGELKLMALRSVMSPHFIFNVLNSIQFFISKNDRLNAITYLTTFSKLIRSILTHSVDNKIKLADEIDMLKNYVQLEMVRFENKFNFILSVDPTVDVEAIEIPSLLIQPYVENAILHGLYNKPGAGTLRIDIYEENETVIFQIEDDGIGREAAMKLRKKNFPTHKSMGINLTEERLQLINQKHNVAFEILDLKVDDVPSGTRVRVGVIC